MSEPTRRFLLKVSAGMLHSLSYTRSHHPFISYRCSEHQPFYAGHVAPERKNKRRAMPFLICHWYLLVSSACLSALQANCGVSSVLTNESLAEHVVLAACFELLTLRWIETWCPNKTECHASKKPNMDMDPKRRQANKCLEDNDPIETLPCFGTKT